MISTGDDVNAGNLPTADQILAAADTKLGDADRALSDAADWLRSDWHPVGSALTKTQAARKKAIWQAISTAKAAISKAKRAAR